MLLKYAVVATNPPYLNKYDAVLKKFVIENYKDYSGDLFSIFIYRNFDFCQANGYTGFMTPFVWMYIQTYEKLRDYILSNKGISSLIEMEYSAFEEATVPICTFVLSNAKKYNGTYFKLTAFTGGMEVQRRKFEEALLDSACKYKYDADSRNFYNINHCPISYWATENVYRAYKSHNLDEVAKPRHGLATSNNNLFLKMWFEVEKEKESLWEKCDYSKKWFPMNKGGAFRRWYGNLEWVINYENDGKEIKDYAIAIYGNSSRTIQNTQFYFKESLTWSALTSGAFSVRWSDRGALFGSGGYCAFVDEDLIYYILALMNNKVNGIFIKLVSPTLNYEVGHIKTIPVVVDADEKDNIDKLARDCVKLSKNDWDSFETSWDFDCDPIVRKALSCGHSNAEGLITIEYVYRLVAQDFEENFQKLKENEEELNRIFIDIYGLQDELTPEVEDKDVTVRRSDRERDIKNLISYAVGCMMGRYNYGGSGLEYAGGTWDASKYKYYPADADGILPICDDEYFEDDIVGRFVDFVKEVFGIETLEENLKYIADSLGGSGAPREVIRYYFLNGFYTDHLKMYQKRPIYWLFDSGKKNGFKCLVYMHRYKPDTIARIRTDYVHEQQSRYRTAIAGLERQIADASTSERVRLNKRLSTLKAQAEETRKYEEKIHHLADQMISIDLDDGVKHNYEIFKDVLAKIK